MDYQGYKYWKTGLLCYTYMCTGISWSIIGPTIPDLCQRMNITPEQIGLAMSASSFSWMAGTIIFGILLDRFILKYDLFVFGVLMCLGTALVAMPLTTQLWVYTVCAVIKGLGDAVVELVCNAITLTLWGKDADGPLFFVHFFWTVGSIITPLYTRPFLGYESDFNYNITNTTTENPIPYSNEIIGSKIEIAYAIGGSICFIGGLISLGTYVVGAPKGFQLCPQSRSSFKEIFNLGKLTETSTKFAVPMCILLFLYYFFLNGAWSTGYYWIYTYAIESDLPFTPQQASTLDAANKISYSIGHLIYGLLLKLLNIQKIFLGSVVTGVGLTLGLATFGTNTKLSLYILTCLHWVAIVALWAGCFAFLDKYLVVTATVLLFANVGASMSGFVFSWLAGWIFTYQEPEDVFWLIFGCMAATSVIVVIMQVIAMKRGSRFNKVDTMNVEVEENGFANSCKPEPDNGEVTVIKPIDMLPTNYYENNDIKHFEHSTDI